MPWHHPHPWFNLYILKKDKSSVAMCGLVILGLFCLLEILLCMVHIFLHKGSIDVVIENVLGFFFF